MTHTHTQTFFLYIYESHIYYTQKHTQTQPNLPIHTQTDTLSLLHHAHHIHFRSFALKRWKIVKLEAAWSSLNAKMAHWKKIIIELLEEEVDDSTPQQGEY